MTENRKRIFGIAMVACPLAIAIGHGVGNTNIELSALFIWFVICGTFLDKSQGNEKSNMNGHQEKMWKEAVYIFGAFGLLFWQPSATNALLVVIVILLAEYFRHKGN